MNFRRSTFTMSLIIACIFALVQCMHKESDDTTIRNSNWGLFAGSANCAHCHKNIYDNHIKTAHYLSSRPASSKYIKGSFSLGRNKFVFTNEVEIVMESRDSSFYQVEYIDGVKKRSGRFDIVFGSGKKGQSFLSWYKNRLFQLPITFFTQADQWTNSPGFPDRAVFNRPITSRCMECHSTYAQKISDPASEREEFDHNRIIYGIDCEKCHGPAAKHVDFQSRHPLETKAKFIVNPATLSRQQNIDMCALCHGGRLNKTTASFQFMVGDTLSHFFAIDTTAKDAADIDVHGNQYGLLAASKCFNGSKMTCNNCHNTHENETGNLALFSQRCINCHNVKHENFCKMSSRIGSSIVKNCIDCHMPKQSSRSIVVMLQGATAPTPALMRSHFIKVYPEETAKVLTGLKEIGSDKPSSKSKQKSISRVN